MKKSDAENIELCKKDIEAVRILLSNTVARLRELKKAFPKDDAGSRAEFDTAICELEEAWGSAEDASVAIKYATGEL